jgi:hypothetical protein
MSHELNSKRIYSFSSWRSQCWPESFKMSLKTTFLSKTTVRVNDDLKIVLLKYYFPYKKNFEPP